MMKCRYYSNLSNGRFTQTYHYVVYLHYEIYRRISSKYSGGFKNKYCDAFFFLYNNVCRIQL